MLTGVQSDEYIRKNCWETTAPLDFRRKIGKPIKIPASGNFRRDFTFVQQAPTLLDLSRNIISITPKMNRPANADLVPYVMESLVKNEATDETPFVINYNEGYSRYNADASTTTDERPNFAQMAGADVDLPEPQAPLFPPAIPPGYRMPSSMGLFPREIQAALRTGNTRESLPPPSSGLGGGVIRTTGAGGMRGGMSNPRSPGNYPAPPEGM